MLIRFPAYRHYTTARIEANDAMMALLIGARLGQHALATSAAGDDVRLPSLFGRIPAIERLNRTTAEAAALLDEAERHLAYMAIPYVLSAHGALLVDVAEMLRNDGRDDEAQRYRLPWQGDLAKLALEIGHEYVAERAGGTLDENLLILFHFTRRVRNRIIHSAGEAGSRLPAEYRSLPGAVRQSWARLVVQDYRQLHPQRFGERGRRLHRVQGHATRLYGGLRLTQDELTTALEA